MPNISIIIEKPASLEASLPVPPKKPRNMARKRARKKLKLSKATKPEVSSSARVVVYCRRVVLVLTSSLVLLQDIPSSDPVDQGDEDIWEMVGAAAERSISQPPATEEVVPGPAQQETSAVNSQASAEEA
jgi:hypothetical protein